MNEQQLARRPGQRGNFSVGGVPNGFQLAYALSRWQRHNLYCPETKRLFGFTAKAGCSTVAKLFFSGSGKHEETDYLSWPHRYRLDYQKQCPAGIKSWMAPDVLKVKFVRDPFTRVVSSYTHVMRTRLIGHLAHAPYFKKNNISTDFSFQDFIHWLETINLPLANPHIGTQHFLLEGSAFRYDFVVRLEEFEKDLDVIRRARGIALKVPDNILGSRHHLTRQEGHHSFVGNAPYSTLGITSSGKNAPPYSAFYNSELIRKVAKLFARDIQAYGYSNSPKTF